MTRLEKKIDTIQETTISIRESLARLEGIPAKVQEHDQMITDLRIQAEVAKTYATKRQLWFTNSLALIATLISISTIAFNFLSRVLNSD